MKKNRLDKFRKFDSRVWTDFLVGFGYEPSLFIDCDGHFKPVFYVFVTSLTFLLLLRAFGNWSIPSLEVRK